MYRHIFVAIDDSNTSNKALQEAITLAKLHGSSLEIAHAIDEHLVHVFNASGGAMTTMHELKHVLTAGGEDVLGRATAQAEAAGLSVKTRLLRGHGQHADDLIAEAVEAAQADLLVVGSHGRRGVRRLLLGSVAENLVRKVGVSVLIVRGLSD